ncbi:ATP-binding protein [Chondromyces apiculatus]|uniref:histidine kinase n=1 Tax=Chondromyces apiculatus DSM 436 TaxID=1192034 RepID=A0A017T870_9BACT|nr:ATP-binding protein [Chondromyces apiculatus]EYF05434.1 Hypothetical protein CAP_3351 [Chondromyces apiculatus DSM 436]
MSEADALGKELAEARKELAEARKELAEARKEAAETRKELAEARKEAARLREELAQARRMERSNEALPQLQEGGALLEAVLHTSVAAITMLDTAGRIVSANGRAETILGLTTDELLRRTYNAPEWQSHALDGGPLTDEMTPFAQVMRSGQPVFDVRQAITWPDGRRKLLSINGAPIRNARGEIVSVVCSVNDITQRLRTEQILQRIVESTAHTGQAYIASLVQALGEGLDVRCAFVSEIVGEGDRARSVAVWRDGAAALDFEHALAGTPCAEVVAPRVVFHRRGVAAQFPADPRLREMAAESYLGVPLISSSKRILGLMALISDEPIDETLQPETMLQIFADKVAAEIERKHAEDESRRSATRLRQAARIARLGIWEWDLCTGAVQWSDEMCAIYGVTHADVTGKADDYLDRIHPDDRPEQIALLQKLLDSVNDHSEGASWDGTHEITPSNTAEFRLMRPDGAVRSVSGHAMLTVGPDGKPQRLLGTLLDLTEQKQAEAEREELRSRLLQAQKMESIGRLAGGVAHDFNNLLTAILCCAELGAQRGDGERAQDYFQQITEAAGRGARLTGQLLAFARKQVLEPRVLDLNELVERGIEMLRRLIGAHVEIVWIPARDLGRVKGDAGQIEQVLVNLVVNARDAMPSGGRVTIETADVTLTEDYAHKRTEIEPGEYVMLAVTDTGSGIAPELMSMIFEPFFTTKEAGKGTGLGLATCYGIVKQHRGHLAVYSEPGRGATFRVYLPQAKQPLSPRAATSEVTRPTAGTETVLIVEDYGPVRTMIRELFVDLGYTVLVAQDGEEALETARAHRGAIDILVTDVIMPRMGGKELAAHLVEERPHLRVLYTSGYAENAIVQHGILRPGSAFIAKPYRPSELAERVRVLLDEPPPAGVML